MRALGWFWASVLLTCGVGIAVLQWLGPPGPAGHGMAAMAPPPSGVQRMAAVAPPPLSPQASAQREGQIAPPDPALLEPVDPTVLRPVAGQPPAMLPRIGSDHRLPMQVYAAPFDPAEHRPMVAILLAGIGMSQSDSLAAINGLPSAVSLAVSPYVAQPEPLLAQARARGHEFFLSLPMEPRGYPIDDPGNEALMVGNTDHVNEQHLAWTLSRIAGYVGATGALGALRGERFADSPVQFEPVLAVLQTRGLMYVDPRPWGELPTGIVGRAVDLVIDDTPDAREIDAKLAKLEDIAQHQGSAIGLISLPRPVGLDRLAAWTDALAKHGLVLAPVSTVAHMKLRPAPSQQAGALPVAAQPATP